MLLKNYLEDGAGFSAQAVMCILKGMGDIEDSWNEEFKVYDAEININQWFNGRERGYVITLVGKDHKDQMNIAFFEHRNSDGICAVKWEQPVSINPPTLDTAMVGQKYKTKWDVSKSVSYDKHYEMAEWIKDQLTAYWDKTSKRKLISRKTLDHGTNK